MKRRKTSGIGILVAAQDRQAVPHRSELGCLGGEDLHGKLARQGVAAVNQDQAGHLYRPFVVRDHQGQEIHVRISRVARRRGSKYRTSKRAASFGASSVCMLGVTVFGLFLTPVFYVGDPAMKLRLENA